MSITYEEIAMFYESLVCKTLNCDRSSKGASTDDYRDAYSKYVDMISEENVQQKDRHYKELVKRLKDVKEALVRVVNKVVINDADQAKFLNRIEGSDFLGITETIGELRGYLHFTFESVL